MSSLTEIQSRVKSAVEATMREYTEQLAVDYKARRTKDRVARTKAVKRVNKQWIEEYDLRVRHEPVRTGRDCHISIEGCSRRFHIQQNGTYGMFDPWNNSKAKINPRWYVYVIDDGKPAVSLDFEDHTNFESLVQQCICMMVGHAYYEASL